MFVCIRKGGLYFPHPDPRLGSDEHILEGDVIAFIGPAKNSEGTIIEDEHVVLTKFGIREITGPSPLSKRWRPL